MVPWWCITLQIILELIGWREPIKIKYQIQGDKVMNLVRYCMFKQSLDLWLTRLSTMLSMLLWMVGLTNYMGLPKNAYCIQNSKLYVCYLISEIHLKNKLKGWNWIRQKIMKNDWWNKIVLYRKTFSLKFFCCWLLEKLVGFISSVGWRKAVWIEISLKLSVKFSFSVMWHWFSELTEELYDFVS